MVDRDGSLWVGTDAVGVVRIHGATVERYRKTDGLSGDSVWALFEDREGIVWAGTTSGIDSFRDPRVVTFSATQGLGKDLAAGILASRDGTVWVANHGSLDRIRNGTVTSIGRSDGLPGNQVAAMLEDRAGNLWVGVDDGLYLFEDGRFRRLPEPDHQPLGMVLGLTEDVEGNIWAACGRPRKLVRIRDFQVRDVFSAAQVPAGAHHLAPDPRGGIWIATSTGDVVLMRNGRVETTIPLDPTSSPLNRHIVAGDDGFVLVGSENGLVGWRAGTSRRMTTKNGLPCDFVIAFVQDNAKHWWLYTTCGVVGFSDSELQKWWANPDVMVRHRVYDAFDGAQPNIGSFNAAASTSDGRVWFSSGVVVQMLDPSRISQPAGPAAAAFVESVVADRKEFATLEHLEFGPRLRDLQIDYTSPTLSVPQKVTFRYRLDGYDDGWREAGPRRQAFYTDVPPGRYTFRVMAANSDGAWNERAATLTFSVAPAYYQTTWFRAVSLLSFVALLWAAHRYRMRQVQHAFALTLDARVGERTRIARELHDTLLQSFHGLLLRFQTASHLLPERPAEAKDQLDGAIEQAAKAITEGRDAVQGLRASIVERNDLAVAIGTLADELATDAIGDPPPTLDITVEGRPRDLHPILRDDIYKIAAEALRNAFRHAHAGRVEVDLRYDDEQFRLRVRDDGKGIDPAVLANRGLEGHYGLHGMPERAALIGGKLAVWSEVGSGTEIELRLPASTVYAISRRRSWWSWLLVSKTAERGGGDPP